MSNIAILRSGKGLDPTARHAIEAEIEALIALLDAADGDPDIEEDDPSGDMLDIQGEMPSDDGQPLMRTQPAYGVDQTKGPINEREAMRTHYAASLKLIPDAVAGSRYWL